MGRLKKFAAGLAAGAAGVAWLQAAKRRNAALERPPVGDASGEPLPSGLLRYGDGEEVEYIDAGEGRALVWVPGADGPKETFRYQLPHFARSWRVVSADLRRSFAPTDGFDRFVEDLLELLAALDIDRCVLIGQSLGSAITIRFASLFPERLDGIVLANPLARVSYEHLGLNRTALIPVAIGSTRYLPTPLGRDLARLWSRLGLWVYDDSPGREALIEYALNTGPRTTPASVSRKRVKRLEAEDLMPELPAIRVPALVVKGPHDVYCPVSWALQIADALPRSRYVPIPGTGHCSHISRPGAFNRAIEDWLEELARDEAAEIVEPASRAADATPDGEDA
ncbi:MAG: alpha/beta hydrolase [Gemmatimonadota bacterium]|nr:alpha/beta hydrolase [Gemmatimonadota bacterium]